MLRGSARRPQESLESLRSASSSRLACITCISRLDCRRFVDSWIVPIPGTTKLHRLEENLGAAAVELTADDLREIEDAAAEIRVHGARYPENL